LIDGGLRPAVFISGTIATMTISSAKLERALDLHRRGRLSEAASVYQEVLAAEPRNADALHLLGLVMAAMGRAQDAVNLIGTAVSLQPSNAAMRVNLGNAFLQLGQLEPALANFGQAVRLAPKDAKAHNSLGVALERANRSEEALHCFRQAAAFDPANAEAHHNAGLLLAAQGRHADALASIERALALQPQQAAAHTNRGTQLLALERPAEALASFDQALALQPNAIIPHHNRGLALMSLDRHAEALASFDCALVLAPDHAPSHLWRAKALIGLDRPDEALLSLDRTVQLAPPEFESHFQRGVALAKLERYEESVACFGQAIALDRNSPEALNNRGAVLVRLFRPVEALEDFVKAIEERPNYADAYINAGNTQKGMGRHLEALKNFDRALALKPEDATATWSKAVLKLALGAYRDGWPLYEARFRLPHARALQRRFDEPRWTGAEPLEGKTLFVYAEQGLGDTLQFCRYISLLEARGANVVFEVQPQLKKLLQSLDTRAAIVGRGDPLPPFDLHTPLLSLPLAFHTEADSIPGGVPYLKVDPGAVHSWGERVAALPGFRVGLNWHGNPEAEKHSALQARSFPLSAAGPLAQMAGVSLVSLQKGPGADQLAQVEFGAALAQLTDPARMGPDEIADETAAILMGLDLLITADTALAHLAGALGVAVWVVLQAVPDWRWLTDRNDSPWYPTMRLFRQRTPGDWSEVLGRVAENLRVVSC
jgi:tetratricopeptide (TPR) repeat protein